MYKQSLNTSSGMWALWDYDAYKEVCDYEDWEPLFCEDKDIEKQIAKMFFVPIYIHEDGCCDFTLKINESLVEKEEKYMCVQSEEYLFYSHGKVVLSGIDYISSTISKNNGIIIDLPKGYYSVTVYLISWDEDPQAFLPDGNISPDALSDFIVLLKSEDSIENKVYRKSLETFES